MGAPFSVSGTTDAFESLCPVRQAGMPVLSTTESEITMSDNRNQENRDGAGKQGTERDRNGDNRTDRNQSGADDRKGGDKR